MSDPGRRGERAATIPALVATALLTKELPDSDQVERAAAARYVDDSVAAMPDVLRAGVRVASLAVYGALSVMGGRPFRRTSPERQAELASRLTAVPLPIVGEFGRLTRGLGLVGVFEQRYREDARR